MEDKIKKLEEQVLVLSAMLKIIVGILAENKLMNIDIPAQKSKSNSDKEAEYNEVLDNYNINNVVKN